jgi:hypothetical protein
LRFLNQSFLWLFAGDGIVGDGKDLAVEQAITREVERINLDRRVLPGLDKADVTVRDHRLNLEVSLGRYDGHECLGRRYHPADRMDCELLHHTIDRRR